MKEPKETTAGVTKEQRNSEGKAWRVIKGICKYIYMFRGVFISIPVVVVAIMVALKNAARLPETVGLEILSTGDYATTVTRTTAVLLPLVLTGVCVLLTILSKRTLFPWLVSVFTLVLPFLIWFTNIYPT